MTSNPPDVMTFLNVKGASFEADGLGPFLVEVFATPEVVAILASTSRLHGVGIRVGDLGGRVLSETGCDPDPHETSEVCPLHLGGRRVADLALIRAAPTRDGADARTLAPLVGETLARTLELVMDLMAQRKASRARDSRHALILDTIPQGVFWKDRDSVYLGCNASFARAAGLESADAIVGKTDFELPWGGQATTYRADDQAVITSGSPRLHYLEPVRTTDTGVITVDTSKLPLRGAGGQVVGVVGIFDDVTARVRAEEAARLQAEQTQALLRLNQMLDAPPDALTAFALDAALRLTRSAGGLIAFVGERGGMTPVASPSATFGVDSAPLDALSRERRWVVVDARLWVPVFDAGRLVVVLALEGGSAYDDFDGERVTLLGDAMWRLLERKRAQAERAANEALVRRTLDEIQDAVVRTDLQGRITQVSRSAVQLYGCDSPDEMIGLPGASLYATEAERESVRALVRERGEVRDHVARARRKDGGLFWISLNARCLHDDHGQVAGIEGFVRDISERVETEARLRAQDAKYRAAFMTGPDAFYWATLAEGRILEVNAPFEKLFGYSRDEAIGKTSLELGLYADPVDRQHMVATLRAAGSVQSMEIRTVRKGGEEFDLSLSASAVVLDGEHFILGVLRDITAEKRAERELEAYRTHLEALVAQRTKEVELLNQLTTVALDSASVGAWWLEPDHAEVYVALDTTARLIGVAPRPDRHYSTAEWVAVMRETQRLLPEHADKIDQTLEHFTDVVSGRDERYRSVYPLALPGGGVRWIDARADVSSRDELGRPRLLTGTVIDVTRLVETERALTAHKVELEALVARRTEELAERNRALQDATERLTLATRAANIGVWDWRVDDDVLDWDDGMFRLYGVRREDFAGASAVFLDALHPDDRDMVLSLADAAVRGDCDFAGEFRIVRPDGEVRYLQSASLSFRGPDGRASRMVGINLDVTDRKRAQAEKEELEERLMASQKMEAIGLLAGGVAHDFNNILSVILSFTGFAMAATSEGDPRRDDLLEVSRAAQRAVSLTRQLLAFSRKQIFKPEPLDLNAIVNGVERILRRILREDIQLETTLAPDLGAVMADPGQLEQVLMNLVVNARDAMPGGGRLTIATANTELHASASPDLGDLAAGSYVELRVSDTGHGMDKATCARVFEPFFTTKEQGKGTGLGLSTVFGIVKQSGGDVRVASEPGHGATFTVLLPRIAAPAPPRSTRAETGRERRPGAGTILVVDDERALRNAARRVLKLAGYEVLVAANGEEALELGREFEGQIQVLLTDVIMPGMSGDVLARALLEREPGLKVIFMSGHSDEAVARYGVLEPGARFITKPFTGGDLEQVVREVLVER